MSDDARPSTGGRREGSDDGAAIREQLGHRASSISAVPRTADLARRVASDEHDRRRRHRVVAGAVAATLLLVGGTAVAVVAAGDEPSRTITTGPGPEPSSSTSPTTTTTSTTSVIATSSTVIPATTTTNVATTVQQPAVEPITDASLLGFGRVGPLEVGADLESASLRIGYQLVTDVVDGPRMGPVAPADVADLPDDACGVVGDVGGQPRLELMTLGDRIVAVTIYEGSGMRTDSGLGIGSTEAEVSAAYPGRVEVLPHAYGPEDGTWHYLRVLDPSRSDVAIVFDTDGEKVISVRTGFVGPVDWVEGCL